MPLSEVLALDPLEPPDRLACKPTHLGELAGDGQRLGADPFLDCFADLRRE
jgi:hypothetical protein